MNTIHARGVYHQQYWTAMERKPNSMRKYNNCSLYWRTPNPDHWDDPTKDDYELFWDKPSKNRFTDIANGSSMNGNNNHYALCVEDIVPIHHDGMYWQRSWKSDPRHAYWLEFETPKNCTSSACATGEVIQHSSSFFLSSSRRLWSH